MTIADIRAALKNELDSLAATYGEEEALTPENNTTVTDNLAGILETVNPNHDYPPTPRH